MTQPKVAPTNLKLKHTTGGMVKKIRHDRRDRKLKKKRKKKKKKLEG